jgi:uncharacterized protein (TIGR04255 family)
MFVLGRRLHISLTCTCPNESNTIHSHMAIEKTTFANPPAFEVMAEVRFANHLRIADERYTFHNLIKAEFPFVVIPTQKQLDFDFGDYTLYTENQAYRLEISMNYFRLVATKYSGYQDFRAMFGAMQSMFANHYGLTQFGNFTLQYKNKFAFDEGTNFSEYFKIDVQLPDELGVKLYAGRGLLAFQQDEGLVLLEFDPQFKGKLLEFYGLNVTFGIERQLVFTNQKNDVAEIFDKAHARLTDFFFAILQPKLLEQLKNQ